MRFCRIVRDFLKKKERSAVRTAVNNSDKDPILWVFFNWYLTILAGEWCTQPPTNLSLDRLQPTTLLHQIVTLQWLQRMDGWMDGGRRNCRKLHSDALIIIYT